MPLSVVQTWEINKGLDLSMDSTDVFDILQSVGISARDAKIQSEQFLRQSSERIGIIMEQGLNEYGFSHLALRDYLAAREIAGSDNPLVNFSNQLYAPKSMEIIPLIAAVLSSHSRKKSSEIINVILNSSTEYDKFTHLDVILVLRCLVDGATIDGETKNRVLTKLREILFYPDQFITGELVHYVGLLLSTPLKDDVEMLLSETTDTNPVVICPILARYHFGLEEFKNILNKIYMKATKENSKELVTSLCSLVSKKAADKDKLAMVLLRSLLNDLELARLDIELILTPLITLSASDPEPRDSGRI
jgi:hypothetical protein